MELLSIPTLGDLFVSQRLNLGAWNDVVRSISCIQSCFAEKAVKNSLAPQLARAVYLEKTRIASGGLHRAKPFRQALFRMSRCARSGPLSRVQQTLARFVEQSGLLKIDELTPIHGDFCFSNLLYDCKVRLVKMIDPRGEFGVPGIFGDRRYDLAKLAHSYAGGYDFIVADQFSVEVESEGRLRLHVQTNDYYTPECDRSLRLYCCQMSRCGSRSMRCRPCCFSVCCRCMQINRAVSSRCSRLAWSYMLKVGTAGAEG